MSRVRKSEAGKRARRLAENLEGWAFITPAVLLVGVFSIFPIFFTLYISLFRWRIRRGDFIGLHNYLNLFGSSRIALLVLAACLVLVGGGALLRLRRRIAERSGAGWPAGAGGGLLIAGGVLLLLYCVAFMSRDGDQQMLDSFRITVWYSLGTVPFQLFFGLILAVLLDRKFRGRQAYRVVFLLPYIVPSVASAAVFERIFSLRPEALANQLLGLFHGKPLQWLYEPTGIIKLFFHTGAPAGGGGAGATGAGLAPVAGYLATWAQGPSLALVAVMLFNWWVFIGYYALIFLNGLSQIPREIYDAAEVDGAKRATVFGRIIVPLVSPSTYFLSLIGIIGTFKAFNHIYVLRNTATQGTIDPMSVYIFFVFFRQSQFGYAAALSVALFIIVFLLTLLERRLIEGRVFYGE